MGSPLLPTAAVLGLLVSVACISHDRYFSADPASDADEPFSPTGSAAPQGAANLTLIHDFGIVRAGDKLTHEFALVNSSNEAWVVSGLVKSCKCTVTKPASPRIPPHSIGRISVTYSSPYARIDDERGVRVLTKLARTRSTGPTFDLRVRARVRPDLSLSDTRVDFGMHPVGAEATRSITIENFSHADWSGVEIAALPDWLDARLESVHLPDVVPRQLWNLTLTTIPAIEARRHDGVVIVRAIEAGGHSNDTSLPVSATFSDPLTLSRSVLFFGQLRVGSEIALDLELDASELGTSVSLSDVDLVQTVGDQLSIAIEARGDSRFVISASLRPNRIGVVSGVVRLQLHDNGRWYTIPVAARVFGGETL